MLLLHTKKSFMDGLATIFDHNCAYCNQKKIHCRVSQKITFLSIVITISIFLIALFFISYYLQGYVCPGILVTATDDEGVSVLRDHWTRHALAAPPGFRIFRLGLSTGCSVTPFAQVCPPVTLSKHPFLFIPLYPSCPACALSARVRLPPAGVNAGVICRRAPFFAAWGA